MAISHPIGARAPWYARTATTAGRPVVLAVTLLMCAPGEYHLARLAGWSWQFAGGMPFALSAYAGIAAVVAANRPKGTRGRVSAVAGAALAIVAALAAQVVSHLITTGHMQPNQAWLVGIVSAVPPAVVGHLLHLAASPATVRKDEPIPPVRQPVAGRIEQPLTPVTAPAPTIQPAVPPKPALPPVAYADPRHQIIRGLYRPGYRPETGEIRAALSAAGHFGSSGAPLSDGWIRGIRLGVIELNEPHLAPAVQLAATAP